MISVQVEAAAALIFSGVIAPAIGIALKRWFGGWGSYGLGPFAVLGDRAARGAAAPQQPDPALLAAELREMLAAKAERQERRGETTLDVDAEAHRLLEASKSLARPDLDEELRVEVRQLVVIRNERRSRRGLAPLDVAAETERQLAEMSRR